jgi:nucleotide-binding universal stress UspA family protein
LQPYFVIESPPTYFDAPGYDPSILLDQLTAEAHELAQQCNSAMREKGITGKFAAYEASIAEDVPAVLLKAADAFGADLIIMGTHGRRGFQRLLLGSVAERCVRQSTRPVLLVPLVKPEAAGTEPSV